MVYEDLTAQAPRFPFHFRQLRAGPHENFHYVVGDPTTRMAALVDPAFEVDRLIEEVEAEGHEVRMAFFTHGHWDHIGGLPAVVERGVERVVVHEAARGHAKVLEAADAGARVHLVQDGDQVDVGQVPVTALHTPGHQPESTCYLAGAPSGPQALFGGDCLFIDSCGRTDLPGGDTEAMFASLARLRSLPQEPVAGDDVVLMPGHDYADRPHEALEKQVERNPALATTRREAFGRLPFLRG